MLRPDAEGWPSDEAFIPIIDEAFYFECSSDWVEQLCREEYVPRDNPEIAPWDLPQHLFDQCHADNIGRCAQVLLGDYPYENGWVQIQACNATEVTCSGWSKPFTVFEPGVAFALGIGILCLVLLNRLRGGPGEAQKAKNRRTRQAAPQAYTENIA